MQIQSFSRKMTVADGVEGASETGKQLVVKKIVKG